MAQAILPLALLIGNAAAHAGAPPPSEDRHATFDAILRDSVVGERVDYARIGRRHATALDAYLDALARTDPRDLEGRDHRLAFYINLYNATMIRAVLDRGPRAFSPADRGFAVFKEPRVRLPGRSLTLDQLEHDVIRPGFDEPRIHVALVCAAVSCPPLLPRAYRAEDLDVRLEHNMRRFINDEARNRIDPDSRTLTLSQLFEWFDEDFGGRDALTAYVQRYTDTDVSGFAVRFMPYDWSLNDVEQTGDGSDRRGNGATVNEAGRPAR